MNYSVAMSFSKQSQFSTEQKMELVEVSANSQEEALGKAINDNWSPGWHLTHFRVIILNTSEKTEQSEVNNT